MARAIEMGTGSGDAAIDVAGTRLLMGFNATEDAAGAAEFIIRDTTATGNKIVRVKLASGGYTTHWFGPQGIRVAGGLYLDRVVGTTTVIVYLD